MIIGKTVSNGMAAGLEKSLADDSFRSSHRGGVPTACFSATCLDTVHSGQNHSNENLVMFTTLCKKSA